MNFFHPTIIGKMKLQFSTTTYYLNLHKIDTVVTHTAPSFCELQNKDGLLQWAIYDNSLLDDVQKERETMDAIYTKLRAETITLTHWYYGHFHQSWHSSIDGVLFKMLDIMELAEITP